MKKVFIPGEKIDLCIPAEEDFDRWASWFNSQEITQFLEQGKYPNTPEQQRVFYEQALASGRFISLVKSKAGGLLGVVSLSDINYEKSWCQIALVCPEFCSKAILAPLEAMAICTQHAFERFGLHQVWAGQAYPGLNLWIQRLELLGYKTDGVIPNGFRHGMTVSDAVRTSVTKDRFVQLMERRGGNLWPGETKVKRLLSSLKSETPLAHRVDNAIKALHHEHDEMLAEIEKHA